MKTLLVSKRDISGFQCRLYAPNRSEVNEIELHHLDSINFQRSGKVEDNDWFMQNNSAEVILEGDTFFIVENGTRHDAKDWLYHCHLDGDLVYDALYIYRNNQDI
jgi:hypothetical protein